MLPQALHLQMEPTLHLYMHCYEEVEVWHARRRHKPARFTSLQVVQTANTIIQVIEWRDNGRRRPGAREVL